MNKSLLLASLVAAVARRLRQEGRARARRAGAWLPPRWPPLPRLPPPSPRLLRLPGAADAAAAAAGKAAESAASAPPSINRVPVADRPACRRPRAGRPPMGGLFFGVQPRSSQPAPSTGSATMISCIEAHRRGHRGGGQRGELFSRLQVCCHDVPQPG